jgi:hypothetical protein
MKEKPKTEELPPNPELLAHKLEQGLAYYKIKKFGKALAYFRELVKYMKELDQGKQQLLVKALQGTISGCLQKGKYRKAIKSTKLTLRAILQLAQKNPEAETELPSTQTKLVLTLQGYLKYTLEHHNRLLFQEFKRGKLSKANFLQLVREGFYLINKSLGSELSDNQKIKFKNTKIYPLVKEPLKELLAWLLEEALRSHKDKKELEALSYCKIATGPLSEALKEEPSEKMQALQSEMMQLQKALESSLNRKAQDDLQSGLKALSSAETLQEKTHFNEPLEDAKKLFWAAIQKATYLENTSMLTELQLHLKSLSTLQEKINLERQSGISQASFLSPSLKAEEKPTPSLNSAAAPSIHSKK